MVERLTTFVEGFRLNDFFRGTEVGQTGASIGFEAGALVRFPLVSAPQFNDDEYLIWGNGDLPNEIGWSLSAFQNSAVNWGIRFTLGFSGGGLDFIEWNLANNETPMTERTLFVHGHWEPDEEEQEGIMSLYVNGLPVAITTKFDNLIEPAITPPSIGSGVVEDPGAPPIEPRLSIAGVCYREGFTLSSDAHFADVWERVQDVDDITQLSAEGTFQWDTIWSARRRLPVITQSGQVWNDLEQQVELVRNGNGGTLQVNAAKAHFWSAP